MRLALRNEEMPYPAVTAIKGMMSASRPNPRVANLRITYEIPSAATARKIKPITSCQREWTGFTAAGSTCFTNLPACLDKCFLDTI
jgi:hypothetical protein